MEVYKIRSGHFVLPSKISFLLEHEVAGCQCAEVVVMGCFTPGSGTGSCLTGLPEGAGCSGVFGEVGRG